MRFLRIFLAQPLPRSLSLSQKERGMRACEYIITSMGIGPPGLTTMAVHLFTDLPPGLTYILLLAWAFTGMAQSRSCKTRCIQSSQASWTPIMNPRVHAFPKKYSNPDKITTKTRPLLFNPCFKYNIYTTYDAGSSDLYIKSFQLWDIGGPLDYMHF